MTTATDGSTSASYVYDPFGRRIQKTVGSAVTQYVYDGPRVIAEYEYISEAYVLTRKYIYALGIDEPLMMIVVDGETEYEYTYHLGGPGSVMALTDSSGDVVEAYSYDIYGQAIVITSEGTDSNWLTPGDGTTASVSAYENPYMFTSRRLDPETGLYYYRFRYYDPVIGRFLQPDPIGYTDGMNRYAYVGNNPVNWVDPWGRCKKEVTEEDVKEAIEDFIKRKFIDEKPEPFTPDWYNSLDTVFRGKGKIKYKGKWYDDSEFNYIGYGAALAKLGHTPSYFWHEFVPDYYNTRYQGHPMSENERYCIWEGYGMYLEMYGDNWRFVRWY